jgi:hypothetical protein
MQARFEGWSIRVRHQDAPPDPWPGPRSLGGESKSRSTPEPSLGTQHRRMTPGGERHKLLVQDGMYSTEN